VDNSPQSVFSGQEGGIGCFDLTGHQEMVIYKIAQPEKYPEKPEFFKDD
jgi:hypothetical protein